MSELVRRVGDTPSALAENTGQLGRKNKVPCCTAIRVLGLLYPRPRFTPYSKRFKDANHPSPAGFADFRNFLC